MQQKWINVSKITILNCRRKNLKVWTIFTLYAFTATLLLPLKLCFMRALKLHDHYDQPCNIHFGTNRVNNSCSSNYADRLFVIRINTLCLHYAIIRYLNHLLLLASSSLARNAAKSVSFPWHGVCQTWLLSLLVVMSTVDLIYYPYI